MKPGRRFFFALAMVISATAPGLLWADMTWEEETTTSVILDGTAYPQEAAATRVALKGDAARIDDRDQAGVRYYNFFNETAIFYSQRNHSFLMVHFRDLLSQTQAQDQQVRQSLDERAAQAERLVPASGRLLKAQVEGQRLRFALEGLPFRLEATGETAALLGHPCRKYRGYNGETLYLETWLAEDIAPDQAFRAYSQALARLDRQSYQHQLETQGFPLKTVFTYGPVQTVHEVKSFSAAPIPVTEFLLPDDAQLAVPGTE